MTRPRRQAVWRWSLWALRAATAAGLAIDAYVHFDLAALYAESGGRSTRACCSGWRRRWR